MSRKPGYKNPGTGRKKIPMIMKLPEKVIVFEQVQYWIELQATQEEVAGSFHVSVETLNFRLMEHFGMSFTELKKRCDGAGKLSLRRYQFKMAEKNTTMAIWLGKQWLGQKDDIQMVQAPNHDLIISLLNEVKALKGKIKLREEQEIQGIEYEVKEKQKSNEESSGKI